MNRPYVFILYQKTVHLCGVPVRNWDTDCILNIRCKTKYYRFMVEEDNGVHRGAFTRRIFAYFIPILRPHPPPEKLLCSPLQDKRTDPLYREIYVGGIRPFAPSWLSDVEGGIWQKKSLNYLPRPPI